MEHSYGSGMDSTGNNRTSRLVLVVALVALLVWAIGLRQSPAAYADGATIEVTSSSDLVINDGAACSLREAVLEANNAGGLGLVGECPQASDTETDTIVLQNGQTYTLSIGGNDNTANAGDLDITDNTAELDLIITTDDSEGTPATIDASGIAGGDRVLQILTGASVRLENIIITGGSTAFNGGGVFNNGTIEMLNTTVTDNEGTSLVFEGGGIVNSIQGILTLDGSTVSDNEMVNGGDGGGIVNRGTMTIQNGSTISGNSTSSGNGGGIFNTSGATLTISDSTFGGLPGPQGNGATDGGGGGIFNTDNATVTISNSTFINNGATLNGGAISNDATATIDTGTQIGTADNANFVVGDGGGVYNGPNGTMTISDSSIQNNVAGAFSALVALGGGVFNEGELTISNTPVIDNRSGAGNGDGSQGGGIFNSTSGTLTLEASNVSGNTTGDGIASTGGGIANFGDLTMTGGEVAENTTGTGNFSGGGGIFTGNNELTLTGVVVRNNTTGSGNNSTGGGLLVEGATTVLTLEDSTVSGNQTGAGTDNDGGGISNAGILNLRTTTLTENQAGGTDNDGGGLYNAGTGIASIDRSVIDGNQSSSTGNAADGGGIFNLGTVAMRNSTVSSNTARTLGGGIYTGSGSNLTLLFSTIGNNTVENGAAGGVRVNNLVSSATFRGTIIADNTANSNPDCEDVVNTIVSEGYNLVGIGDDCANLTDGVNGDQVGTGAAPLDALLAELGDNGGPTRTHALMSASPAINAVPAAMCVDLSMTAIDTDQRNEPRPYAELCDIGAVEQGAQLVFLPLIQGS